MGDNNLIIRMRKIKTMQSFVIITRLNTMVLDSNGTAFTRLQLKEIAQTFYITMILVAVRS